MYMHVETLVHIYLLVNKRALHAVRHACPLHLDEVVGFHTAIVLNNMLSCILSLFYLYIPDSNLLK